MLELSFCNSNLKNAQQRHQFGIQIPNGGTRCRAIYDFCVHWNMCTSNIKWRSVKSIWSWSRDQFIISKQTIFCFCEVHEDILLSHHYIYFDAPFRYKSTWMFTDNYVFTRSRVNEISINIRHVMLVNTWDRVLVVIGLDNKSCIHFSLISTRPYQVSSFNNRLLCFIEKLGNNVLLQY